MTRFFGLVRQLGLSRLFRKAWFLGLFARLGARLRLGREDCILTTRIVGPEGTYQAWLKGRGEGFVTAIAAAEACRRLGAARFPSGVYHIEQVFGLEDFLPTLEGEGVSFAESLSSQEVGE